MRHGGLSFAFFDLASKRWKQPEIDIHRLEIPVARNMSAGNVAEKRAERGFRRWRLGRAAGHFLGDEPPGEEADGGALDIAFDASDLAAKRIFDCAFMRNRGSRTRGLLRKVLR